MFGFLFVRFRPYLEFVGRQCFQSRVCLFIVGSPLVPLYKGKWPPQLRDRTSPRRTAPPPLLVLNYPLGRTIHPQEGLGGSNQKGPESRIQKGSDQEGLYPINVLWTTTDWVTLRPIGNAYFPAAYNMWSVVF